MSKLAQAIRGATQIRQSRRPRPRDAAGTPGPEPRPAPGAVGLAAALALAVLAGSSLGGPVLAQSAIHAPGKAATHAADLSGIWESAETDEVKFARIRKLGIPYNAEWAEKYRVIHERALRGEHIDDGTSRCLLPGAPRFFIFLYPIEILMTPGQITVLTEYFNETRRIFTDGRRHPSADDLEPTFRGHSIGHWEGKTLVVDTVGVRNDTYFSASGAPHSDQMHITERIRLTGPNTIEWVATIEDPVALTKPYVQTALLKRAPATDEIREYVCAESQNVDKYAPATTGQENSK